MRCDICGSTVTAGRLCDGCDEWVDDGYRRPVKVMCTPREEDIAMVLRDKIDTIEKQKCQSDKDADFYRNLSLNFLEKILRQVTIISDYIDGREDDQRKR